MRFSNDEFQSSSKCNDHLLGVMISNVNIRWMWDHLLFIMGILHWSAGIFTLKHAHVYYFISSVLFNLYMWNAIFPEKDYSNWIWGRWLISFSATLLKSVLNICVEVKLPLIGSNVDISLLTIIWTNTDKFTIDTTSQTNAVYWSSGHSDVNCI